MNEFNPDLAVDLAPAKDAAAVDLSKEAVEARAKMARMKQAAEWAAAMQRAFKGISGAPTRRQRVLQAIEKFDLR